MWVFLCGCFWWDLDLGFVSVIFFFNGFVLDFGCLQVRIQLGQGSAVHVSKNMLKQEGLGAFYKVCVYIFVDLINNKLLDLRIEY